MYIHIFAVVTKAINKYWAGKAHIACGYCFASCQKRACSSLQNKDREGLSLYLLRDHSELKRDRPFDLHPDFINLMFTPALNSKTRQCSTGSKAGVKASVVISVYECKIQGQSLTVTV